MAQSPFVSTQPTTSSSELPISSHRPGICSAIDLAISKAPSVSDYASEEVQYGEMAMAIEKRWTCQMPAHAGENGTPGFCYIIPETGGHAPLKLGLLKKMTAYGVCIFLALLHDVLLIQ
jgi:hypothetical protein